MKKSLLVLVFALVCLLSRAQLHYTPDTLRYTTDGTVNAMQVWNNHLYLAGDFSYVGKNKMGFLELTPNEEFNYHWPDFAANQMVPDGHGGVFALNSKIHHVSPDGKIRTYLEGKSLNGVKRIALSGDTLWVVGSFTAMTNTMGPLVQVNGNNYTPLFGTNDGLRVQKVIDDGLGGYFLHEGSNRLYKNKLFSHFVHLDANMEPTSKTYFAPTDISLLKRQDTLLFIGGAFSNLGESSDIRIFNIPSWTSWNLNVTTNGTITTCFVHGGYLYVAGSFSQLNGQAKRNLGRINISNGQVDSWNPDPNKTVHAFERNGSEFFVGGEFDSLFQHVGRAIVTLDVTNPTSVMRSFSANASVFALAFKGDTLYAGGQFTQLMGTSRGRCGAIDLQSNTLLSFNPALNNTVTELFLEDNKLWAKGTFTNINSGPMQIGGLAVYDANNHTVVSFSNKISGTFSSVVKSGNGYALGGYFGSDQTNEPAPYVIAINIHTGQRITANIPIPNGAVNDIAVKDGYIIMGGSFTKVNNTNAANLAVIKQANGQVQPVPAPSDDVYRLFLNGDKLYFSGPFGNVGGEARENSAAILYKQNHLLAWKINYSYSPTINAIVESNGLVFIAGLLQESTKNYTHLISTDTAGVMRTWNPGPNSEVRNMYVANGVVYIFGEFNGLKNNSNIKYAAGINASTNSVPFSPLLLASVGEVCMVGDNFLMGGGSMMGDLVARNGFAVIDLDSGILMNRQISHAGGYFTDLEIWGDTLAVAGTFTSLAGRNNSAVAFFNLQNFGLLPLDLKLSGFIMNVEFTEKRLYVQGGYLKVNGLDINNTGCFDRRTGTMQAWTSGVEVVSPVAFKINNDAVYLGCIFPSAKGIARQNLVAVDTINGAVLPWNPGANGLIRTIALRDTFVYIGGDFDSIAGIKQNGFGRVGIKSGIIIPTSGMGAATAALTTYGDRVYYCTGSRTANGKPTGGFGYIDPSGEWIRSNRIFFGGGYKLGVNNERVWGNGNANIDGRTHWEFFVLSLMSPELSWVKNPTTSLCEDTFKIKLTGNGQYRNGNVFALELSDEKGSFSKPVKLIQVEAGDHADFVFTLPYHLPAGNYKIRGVASRPYSHTTNTLDFVYSGSGSGIQLSATTQCLNGNDFKGTYTGSGNVSVQWKFTDVTIPGDSFQRSFNQVGNYPLVVLRTQGSCSRADTVILNVINKPDLVLTTKPTIRCSNLGPILFYDSASYPGMNYTFDPGNGLGAGITFPIGLNFTSGGTFTATLMGEYNPGCADTATLHYTVHSAQKLDVLLLTDSVQCFSGNSFRATNLQQGTGRQVSEWQINGVFSGTADTLTKQFGTAGIYSINMISTDANQCSDSSTVWVRVKEALQKEQIDGASVGTPSAQVAYAVQNPIYAIYQWSVTDGSILNGQGTSSILVEWDATPMDTILVTAIAIDSDGCDGEPAEKLVFFQNVSWQTPASGEWSLYPQPASDYVIIESAKLEMVSVRVFDATGRLVKLSVESSGKQWKLDTRSLKPGLYLVHLHSQEGEVYIEKLLINR